MAANTKVISTMKTILIQLLDSDGDIFGLIKTNVDEVTLQTMYSDYYNQAEEMDGSLDEDEKEEIGYPDDLNADGFVRLLKIKGFQAERIFFDGELNP